MKNIQLKKLELTNYRNIDHAVMEFDGNSKIVGENRIGKTNTLEAIYYLLTDYLLDGSSDIATIKPLKDTSKQVRIVGWFDVDGKEFVLKKEYGENWAKTRGTQELVLKGHSTTYYYNDVKQPTVSAYNSLIKEDFGLTINQTTKLDILQLLVNPFYVGNMGDSNNWTTLREFIINLVGDVSNEDVYVKEPITRMIADDLSKVNNRVDQLKKQYKGEIESLKDQILGDDAQISMLEKTEEPTDESVVLARKYIEEHEANIRVLLGNVGTVDNASLILQQKINEKTTELNRLSLELLRQEPHNKERNELQSKIDELYAKIEEVTDKKAETTHELSVVDADISTKSSIIAQCNLTRTELIAQIRKIDSEIANPTEHIQDTCPFCHRKYENIDELVADFVAHKKQEREKLLEKGKANKTKKDLAEQECAVATIKADEIRKVIDVYNQELERLRRVIDETKNKLTALMDKPSEPIVSPEIATLKAEIEELKQQLAESKNAFEKGRQNNSELIQAEQDAMTPYRKVIADLDYYNRQMETLAEVYANKKEHQKKLADAEQKKVLIDSFIYTKLSLLDENVSKVFGGIKFQLIKENINGGFDPVCKPYIYDIDKGESTTTLWKSGSKSERVITGVAIAECIKKALDLPNLPYLFDEGGEISTSTFATKFKTDAQIICVKVVDSIPTPLVQKI